MGKYGKRGGRAGRWENMEREGGGQLHGEIWKDMVMAVRRGKYGKRGGGYQILSGLHIYGTFTVRTVCNLCHIYSAFYNVTNLCTVRRVPNL